MKSISDSFGSTLYLGTSSGLQLKIVHATFHNEPEDQIAEPSICLTY